MSIRSRDAPADPPDEESQSLLVSSTPEQASSAAPKKQAVSFGVSQTTTSPSSSAATSSPVISALDRMAGVGSNLPGNPVLLAKLVVRKFLQVLLTEEEEGDPNSRLGFVIGLLKDIILGVVFGVLTISFAIVLDHRNIIHIQSAHHLRDAAYAAINDPVTIANIEEETDLKFMSVSEYDSAKKEIDDSLSNLEKVTKKLEERSKELEEKQKDFETIKTEYETLMKDPKLKELDNFCGECKWGGNTGCAARVEYLGSQYKVGKLEAKMGLMKDGKCKK